MTQELLAVILEQKSYNTLKVPVFGDNVGDRKQKIAASSSLRKPPEAAIFQIQRVPVTDQAISRNSRRRIFPTGVIGKDSRSTMCFGTLYAVKFSLQ